MYILTIIEPNIANNFQSFYERVLQKLVFQKYHQVGLFTWKIEEYLDHCAYKKVQKTSSQTHT